MTLFFQGDVCIESVESTPVGGRIVAPASDGAVVLAEGEATGHRHAFYGGGVTLFRDDALARDIPADLYVGHFTVERDGAELKHEEHDTIVHPKGTYRVRLQREFEDQSAWVGDLRSNRANRIVRD